MKTATVVRRLLPLTVVATIAGFAVYKFKFAPTQVTAHTVTAETVTGEVMGTGTLEARVKTIISPRIQERLAAVLVDQGDHVKAGQILVRLEDAEARQQVAIAEASLAATRKMSERVGADLARSEAVLAQARLDHQRLTSLVTSSAVSRMDVDKSAESLKVAEADLKRSRAAISEAQGQVLVAENTLLHRKEQMAFTEIRSPYDGLIVRRDRDAGGIVVPGSSILQLISTDEIWVSAWVDETAMAQLAPGQPARVIFRSEPGKTYPGEVVRLGRETDRETREFLVDVSVRALPKQWAVGQRAEVYVETGHKDSALVLPLRFLSWRGGRPGVFVNAQGRARWRPLKMGLRGLESAEVLEGLAAGDSVCMARVPKVLLSDGQRIIAP